MELGYHLSSEEWGANELVHHARRAEESGFTFALISDHYHPWTERQGQSPFVWGVLGGIARATQHLRVGTGVTCPTIRIHPAILAQSAATIAAMMPGRFFFGLGSGENVNEHVVGAPWPPTPLRLEMLAEAIEVMRLLWEGGQRSYEGLHYVVEHARVYTLPDPPPPMFVAAGGPHAAALAGQMADGLICSGPNGDLVETFNQNGGDSRPRYGKLTVCWAPTEAEARRTAHEWWPNTVLGKWSLALRLPSEFEEASSRVTEEQVAAEVLCSPDPEAHVARVREFERAGFDHVWVHQVGPDQEGFFNFYSKEVMPKLR